ncbi:AAA family ATPase [Roseibium sediminicola]|uniref:ATP-binding protein n=1 Tax=Roseibium sediminicola TaxID=2933272 RepID=A0ABT0GRZ3_9HYPH|nr:ATP-binding protein [Roseibium sp. CAU 1639]MCK7612213.1 ATP-binding protein [Roseibium sp. CAU 1639]
MSEKISPVLHLLCGKVASGKSTLADRLACEPNTVLLREDALLSGLYGEDMQTLKDFVEYSGRLRRTIAPHIVALLKTGTAVVLDFQANTKDARAWMKGLFEQAECDHRLHVLDVPDEICKARLKQRNASGKHEFSVTEEQFDRISNHFQRPTEDEGFVLEIHRIES